MSLKIEPKTKADQEKMGMALSRLAKEDPTFKVSTDKETFDTVISVHPALNALVFAVLFFVFLSTGTWLFVRKERNR